MTELNLDELFDPALGVRVSAGVTTQTSVHSLPPLNEGETPHGYATWADKRRREFHAGRHHARRALAKAGGPGQAIGRDEDGVPLFPRGFSGSITHTGREVTFAAAAIVVSPMRVGIDAEVLRQLPEDMVAHILSDAERELLGREQKHRRSPRHLQTEGALALLAFSAKEAFYKCVFPPLRCRLGFHEVDFRLRDFPTNGSGVGSFDVTLLKPDIDFAPRTLRGSFLSDEEHVVCGVSWDPSI